jgi:hypothetical protein
MPKDDDPSGSSSEADADTDADTDTDTDADTDHTPNDPQPVRVTSLTGEVTFTSTLEGVPRCDLGVSLTLDPAGELQPVNEALYAPLKSTLVRNDGSEECETTPLVPEDVFVALHSPDADVDFGLRYTPWLWDSGDNLYVYTVADGDADSHLLATNAKDDFSPGSLDAQPNWPPETISWQRSETISIPTGAPDWYDGHCDEDWDVLISETDTLVGSQAFAETLDADGGRIDVWELLVPYYGLVGLRVATDDATLQPVMWVNQGSGCTVIESGANVPCSEKDPGTSCPAIEDEMGGGRYQVVVRGAGVGEGDYELWIGLPEIDEDTLVLVEDDIEASWDLIYRIESSGTVELTTEWK